MAHAVGNCKQVPRSHRAVCLIEQRLWSIECD